ncbi:MAG: hypothetical protein Q8L14_00790 [Myxococcales bacterium]|nr:hypothetical protein [Myxococcales bacterium]
MNDLRLDGWECLRVRDVESTRRGSHERFAQKVLRLGAAPPRVSLGSTRALVESLPPRRLVVVECEADDDFLLGRILGFDDRFVDVHSIDASGRWAGHATRVSLEEITRLQFGDHYSRSFERHGAKWRAPRSAPAIAPDFSCSTRPRSRE